MNDAEKKARDLRMESMTFEREHKCVHCFEDGAGSYCKMFPTPNNDFHKFYRSECFGSSAGCKFKQFYMPSHFAQALREKADEVIRVRSALKVADSMIQAKEGSILDLRTKLTEKDQALAEKEKELQKHFDSTLDGDCQVCDYDHFQSLLKEKDARIKELKAEVESEHRLWADKNNECVALRSLLKTAEEALEEDYEYHKEQEELWGDDDSGDPDNADHHRERRDVLKSALLKLREVKP